MATLQGASLTKLQGYLPKFSVGCRRITPGDPYLAAIQNPNVKVNFIGVEKLVEDGVVHTDGTFTEADTVICATGFDTSFTPRFPIIGKDGISLTEKWAKTDPLAYLSVTVPNLPTGSGGLPFTSRQRAVPGQLVEVNSSRIRTVWVDRTSGMV